MRPTRRPYETRENYFEPRVHLVFTSQNVAGTIPPENRTEVRSYSWRIIVKPTPEYQEYGKWLFHEYIKI